MVGWGWGAGGAQLAAYKARAGELERLQQALIKVRGGGHGRPGDRRGRSEACELGLGAPVSGCHRPATCTAS